MVIMEKSDTYIHNGILFSHQKNNILLFEAKWIEPRDIVLSEASQALWHRPVIPATWKDEAEAFQLYGQNWKTVDG